MRRFIPANLALWVITIATTILRLPERRVLSYLGPLFAVCAIDSATIIRKACGAGGRRPES